MPWSTPTLREVRSLVRDSIRGTLPGADALVPNSVLRVLSDSQGALCHLTLQYVDWLALQLLPDTAETEWLDRHGDIWLTNADGTTGRKMATLATGDALVTGVAGSVVPQGTQFYASGGAQRFEATADVVVAADAQTPVRVRAIDPGIGGNLPTGATMTLSLPVPGLDGSVFASNNFSGGTEDETDDELRMRVLLRIRQPPQGGSATDYLQWALAVPGCTRAWVAPLEMGIGTVTVRVLFDDLRAEDDGWPRYDDLLAVTAYIDSVRPVAVKDFWVVAPVKQPIDVHIRNLRPDTPATRGAIEESLLEMLFKVAAPGQTIFAAWKSYAVMSALGVYSFDMTNTSDDVMETPGHMAVLRDIFYD
jgi:uncharacterized phage protein gp47/JayE